MCRLLKKGKLCEQLQIGCMGVEGAPVDPAGETLTSSAERSVVVHDVSSFHSLNMHSEGENRMNSSARGRQGP